MSNFKQLLIKFQAGFKPEEDKAKFRGTIYQPKKLAKNILDKYNVKGEEKKEEIKYEQSEDIINRAKNYAKPRDFELLNLIRQPYKRTRKMFDTSNLNIENVKKHNRILSQSAKREKIEPEDNFMYIATIDETENEPELLE